MLSCSAGRWLFAALAGFLPRVSSGLGRGTLVQGGRGCCLLRECGVPYGLVLSGVRSGVLRVRRYFGVVRVPLFRGFLWCFGRRVATVLCGFGGVPLVSEFLVVLACPCCVGCRSYRGSLVFLQMY